MKERDKNIWGGDGCTLPNGSLCTACCVLPNIEMEGVYVSVVKPEHSPCLNLGGQGCKLHGKGKPETCSDWHCSEAGIFGKIDLIAQGLSLGFVGPLEATRVAANLIRESGTEIPDMESLIRIKVLDRSLELTRITKQKGLLVRDLDET